MRWSLASPRTVTCVVRSGLSALLLVGNAAPAAEPVMSDVIPLPGDLAIAPAAGDQTSPAIARGGDLALVVWVDEATAWGGPESGADLVAVRLDAAGALIDQTPFVISRNAGYQRDPLVAWNGTDWLVAWENQTPTQFYYQTEVFAARVSPAGTVIDPTPIRPFDDGDAADMLALTSNGSDWLLVTQSYSAGEGGIRARRVAADGTLPGAAPVLLVPATYYLYFNVDVVSAGGEYLLSFSGNSGFEGRRFTGGLTPIGGPFPLPTVRHMASNGAAYYLVFAGGSFGNLILGSPMNVDGTLVLPQGVQLGDASQSSWFETDVAFDGTLWWVSRRDAWLGLTFQRVTAAGGLLDPVGISIDTPNEDFQAAHQIAGRAGGGVTAVWQDHRVGGFRPYDIYAASVLDPETFDAGVPISLAAPMQLDADVAEGPGQYLVTYTSRISGQARVLAVRCDATGAPIDAAPIVIDPGPAASGPAADWNGTHYMLVWNRNGVVMSQRLGPDGVFVDPAPVTVMTGGAPDVAALGADFLVAVTDTFNFPHYRATYVRRMSGATGQPIDAERFIVSYGNFAQLARVVTFAGRWLVTWQDNFSHDDPQSAIYVRLVDPGGGQGSQITVIYSTGGSPDVAVSGDVATFVWRNNSLSNANNYIAGRRMLPDGSFIDAAPFVVSEMPGRQLSPVVAWDGVRFASAWEDQRSQTSFFDDRTDVYGARLAPSGPPVVDPDGYAIHDTETAAVDVAIASVETGSCLTAAALFRDDPGLGTYRVGLRRLGLAGTVPADVTGDGLVDVADLVAVILAWGSCGSECPEDLNGDRMVDVADLVLVITNWS